MGSFKSNLLPDSFRRKMAKDDRKELKTPTDAEVASKVERGQELQLHRDFANWCRLNNVITVHSRTDRKPTIEEGHPDFTLLYGGKGCCIEFKAGNGNVSSTQMQRLEELDRAGVPYTISWNLADAIKYAKSRLGLTEKSDC